VSTQILRLAVGDFVGGELKLARKARKSAKPYSQLENEKAPWTKPSVPVDYAVGSFTELADKLGA